MPGTVQVSILELKGLPSSKSSSSMSIKVSLGKHTYEADGEKSDFLFPLATLRDNLVIKVHDKEGNEIAHTGVKSRSIAEKGSWDDLFPLEGGGHVHMKLKFSLSEDERNRIRNMREIAFRKKQEEILNKNNLQIVVASSGGASFISDKTHSIDLPLKASSKVVSFKSSSIPISSSVSEQVKEDDEGYDLKEQSPLGETPSKVKEDDQPYKQMEQSPVEMTPGELRENDQAFEPKEQSQMKEQSPFERTFGKIQEDDQTYKWQEQSPLQKTLGRLQESDQPYEPKKQSAVEKTLSRLQEDNQLNDTKELRSLEETLRNLQEDDQANNLKEQSPLEETPSITLEDDQPYSMKEQILMEETTPSKLEEDFQLNNSKDQNTPEKTSSKLQEDDQPYIMKEQSPLEKTPSIILEDDQAYNSKNQSALEKTPRKANKDDQPYNLKEQSPLEEKPSKVKDDGQCYNFNKPSPLEKTTTKVKDNDGRYNLKGKNPLEKTGSKIWETIAAFESSQPTQGQKNTAKADSRREHPTSTPDEREPIETRSTTYETKYVDNVKYKSKEILDEKVPKEKHLHNVVESEEIKSSKDLRQPSNLEQDKISGGDHDFSSDENQPSNFLTEQENVSDASSLSERANHESCYDRRGRCSCNNFRGWIFLEEEICTCIVSDNRIVRDLLGDYSVDPGKLVDDEVISSKDDKIPGIAKKSESGYSSGDGTSRGPHGQVMSIVIMVGFGLLVLFTRNRN